MPSDPYSNLGGLNPEITRIKTLIEAIENYGVDKKYIFTVEDLFEKKHIPRVVRCLEEIEKLVQILCLVFLEKKMSQLYSFSGQARRTCQLCIYACQQGLLLKYLSISTKCWNLGILSNKQTSDKLAQKLE